MNIHLPAILMFTRGTRFWHTAIYSVQYMIFGSEPGTQGHTSFSHFGDASAGAAAAAAAAYATHATTAGDTAGGVKIRVR